MNFWTAVVIIVAIGAVASILRARYQAQSGIAHDRPGNQSLTPHPREAELEREVADLKKRLAVLERIATDDRQSKAIAQEIEALRDR